MKTWDVDILSPGGDSWAEWGVDPGQDQPGGLQGRQGLHRQVRQTSSIAMRMCFRTLLFIQTLAFIIVVNPDADP